MLNPAEIVDPERVRNSLYLCVRSVRYMTEQLVTIVSSLSEVAGNYDSFGSDEIRRSHSRGFHAKRYSYPGIESRMDPSSSNCSTCDTCDCTDMYYQDEMICRPVRYPVCRERFECRMPRGYDNCPLSEVLIPKIHGNENGELVTKDSSKNEKTEVRSSQANMGSQTTAKGLMDKQSYTTPEIATQTGSSTKLDNQSKSSKNEPNNPSLLPSVNPSGIIDVASRRESWDRLIRSQIEEVVSKKLSEKLSGHNNLSTSDNLNVMSQTLKMDNSDQSDVLLTPKAIENVRNSSRLTAKPSSKNLEKKSLTAKIVPYESLKVSNNQRLDSRADKLKSITSHGKVALEKISERNAHNVVENNNHDIEEMKFNLQKQKWIEEIRSSKSNQPHSKVHPTSDHSITITLPDDRLIQSSRNTIKDYFAEDNKININDSSNVKSLKNYENEYENASPKSEDLSIYDEFDYVSEVEFVSIVISNNEPLKKVDSSYSEVSVYDSELNETNQYDLFSDLIIDSKGSHETILSDELSTSQSDYSAFSDPISKENSSSKYIRLSDYSEPTDMTDSESSVISNQSEASKYISNIKSINTLSSSLREKFVRYKSISVTNLGTNFSNKTIERFCNENTFSMSNIYNSMDDAESCLDEGTNENINDKEIFNKNIFVDNKVGSGSFNLAPNFQMYDKGDSKSPSEYINKNKHNSNKEFLDDEIFIENYRGQCNEYLKSGSNVVDVFVPMRKIHDNILSSSSERLQSLYCDVVENGTEDCPSAKWNLPSESGACCLDLADNRSSPESKSETIFLQATLAVTNACPRKYKIHFDRKHFSIEDDENLCEMDRLVSCFDAVQDNERKITPQFVKETKKMSKKPNHRQSKIKKLIKKKRCNDGENFSLIECFLDDWSDQGSLVGSSGD